MSKRGDTARLEAARMVLTDAIDLLHELEACASPAVPEEARSARRVRAARRILQDLAATNVELQSCIRKGEMP